MVSNSLFRQVIVNDQCIFVVVMEVFVYCVIGIWCQILQCSGFGCGCYYNNGVSQCVVFFQFMYYVRDGGCFLVDSDIDIFDVGVVLVDDGVDSQCGFIGLMVIDDQFMLIMIDWDYGVNGFIIGLYWLIDRLMIDNVWCNCFNGREVVIINWIFIVDWCIQGVYYMFQQVVVNWNFQDMFCIFNFYVFGKVSVWIYDYCIYGVVFQVQCDSVMVIWQGDYFILYIIGQVVNVDNIVIDRNNSIFVVSFVYYIELSNVLFDQFVDFGGIQLYVLVFLRL